ncbi:hypothetical protein A2U01_0031766, partial [Trifolium medium]|nr:hypothetical protein [Trifolium medium]
MFLDASAGGSVQNKTPAKVEELIQNMCQNQYNKIEDDEEDIMEQLEEMKHKEQLERIKKLQEEEGLQKKKRSEEQKTQTTNLEAIMMQLTKTMGEHMKSSKVEMQHLAEEVSKLKEEQCKAIELRNRKVDIVEKPKQDKRSKTNEVQNPPTQEMNEPEGTEEPDEPIEGKEPVVQESPESTPTPPPAHATQKPQVIVTPYPSKDEKKEIQKELNKKIDGYLTQIEINVPLKDMLQLSP